MDISVNVGGLEVTPAQERRIKKVVQSTVTKELWRERDETLGQRTITVIKEAPTLLAMFLSTTYGIIAFFIAVAVIAIPAAALGGAIYVSQSEGVTTYQIAEQDVPAAERPAGTVGSNPYAVVPASSR